MSVIHADEAVEHTTHGARFLVHASGATGAAELRAWRLEIPGGTAGVEHTIGREEVFHVLEGSITVSVDGLATVAGAGDTAVAPAGGALRIDNPGPGRAAVWVTTSVGLTATLADGTVIAPPWAA